MRTDLQQMGAARDLPGRAVERDSQPTILLQERPTVASTPRDAPSHVPCKRLAGPATSDPGFIEPGEPRRPGRTVPISRFPFSYLQIP